MPRRTPTVCECFDAVGAHYGTTTFATTTVPIRQRQIRRPARYVAAPLLPRLLVPGGRGGADVRIRLWLWCVLDAHARSSRGEDPVLELGRREAATRMHLLSGTATLSKGKCESASRRADNAFARLRREGIIQRVGRGHWRVLSDDAGGAPFCSETESELAARLAVRDDLLAAARHGQRTVRYDSVRRRPSRSAVDEPSGVVVHDHWEEAPIAVPLALWANGWVSGLSGAALLTLLVLLDQARAASEVVVPRIRRSQYALGKEVWKKGRDELRGHRIICVSAGRQSGAVVRDHYQLSLDRLERQHLCELVTPALLPYRQR